MTPNVRLTCVRAIAAGALTFILAGSAIADQISLNGIPIPNVRITGLADGQLAYIAAGTRRSADLEDISRISFDRYENYDDAVVMIQTNPEQAARDLRQILGTVREDFLKPLVNLRMSEALDAAGELDDAIQAWADAVRADSSAYFVERVPSSLPEARGQRDRAIRAAQRVQRQVRTNAARQALADLVSKLEGDAAEGEPQPEPARGVAEPEPATASTPSPEVSDAQTASIMRSIDTYIQSQRYDQATDRIAQMRERMDESLNPVLDYQLGRIAAAQGRPVDAAVWFCRVGLLHPEHELAGSALMQAGRAFESAEQPSAALSTYRVALDKVTDAGDRRTVQERIGALGG